MFGSAHWKVDAIDEYAADRPAAWLDDNLDETCIAWAEGRSAPTLLVETSAQKASPTSTLITCATGRRSSARE